MGTAAAVLPALVSANGIPSAFTPTIAPAFAPGSLRALAHRIYRLAISPDQAPEVRRVVDFDGRHTLADVHSWLRKAFGLGANDHLYSFYLSSRFGDAESEYVDPRTDGRRADKAMLFRLGLRVEMGFVYIYDFGSERRFSLTVLGIADSSQPLGQPVLVESVGEPPVHEDPFSEGFSESEEDWTDDEHPIDATLSALAGAVLDLQDLTYDPEGPPSGTNTPQPVKVFLCQLADAALALAEALRGELKPLLRLDDHFQDRELILCLLALPLDLFDADEVERSLTVAQALAFVSPDEVNGDLAKIYARTGQREAALRQVATNLERAEDRYTAELKAAEVYRALGEDDAAEAYYRRALAEATTTTEIAEARLKVTTLLLDTDRRVEAAAFIAEEGQRSQAGFAEDSEPFDPVAEEPPPPRVGRNEPCPCGSSKKYKKCHGA